MTISWSSHTMKLLSWSHTVKWLSHGAVIFEKLIVPELVKICAFHGIWRLSTGFTRVHHRTLRLCSRWCGAVCRNMLLSFTVGVLNPTPNRQDGKPPLLGWPPNTSSVYSTLPFIYGGRLLQNLRTRHAVVTRDQLDTHTRTVWL
jgi:hypothetical protein